MEETRDLYYTITKPSQETLFKEKGSKFFNYAFPVKDEDAIKNALEELKKTHHAARHFCYAWQLGQRYEAYRANDDGEPNNSAGMPIYGQLQAFDVTNILVVVVRYFGGTKLGVGGLIQAYKTGAQMALEAATIVKKTINQNISIKFDYPEMNVVMRIIKDENLKIISQKMELNCEIEISVRLKEADRIFKMLEKLHKLSVKKV
ncbi:hypothetical protein SCB49_00962 [unidentified eubacterium SCB49]|nr:hypothetical protein SCB49_00962 [unidentified eubacterium SCB49]